MTVELVALVMLWMNALLPSPYVVGNLSPYQIVNSLSIEYVNHCPLQFGEYAQVHKSHDNTTQEQNTGAIYLQPTGNSQGAYFFMSLTTGQRLNRQSFTPLPLPQVVINVVHRLVRRNPKGLDIRDRDQHPFLKPKDRTSDYGDDSTYAPSNDDSSRNEYESDENQHNRDNLHPPPDQ